MPPPFYKGGFGAVHRKGFLQKTKLVKKGRVMRNITCDIADMRKRVFAEVAKMAYEQD